MRCLATRYDDMRHKAAGGNRDAVDIICSVLGSGATNLNGDFPSWGNLSKAQQRSIISVHRRFPDDGRPSYPTEELTQGEKDAGYYVRYDCDIHGKLYGRTTHAPAHTVATCPRCIKDGVVRDLDVEEQTKAELHELYPTFCDCAAGSTKRAKP